MTIPAAYLGVIIIWTTTPLAIKWSGEGGGYLFGVTGRMTVSVLVALLVLTLLRTPFHLHRQARRTYMAAGLGLYGTMMSVYWAAQFIPSGWVSVIFGVTPLVIGVMASFWLGERVLVPSKLFGMLLGFGGLVVIFGSGFELGIDALLGVGGVMLGVLCHSTSSVWVKRLNRGIDGLAVTTGALLVAVPLFLLTWFATDASWPQEVPDRALYSILYLALAGSVVGFALYYYVLKHLDATRVALITLITPVSALLLGQVLNGEEITLNVWLGAACIVGGLACFELGGPLWLRMRASMVG